MARVEDLTRQKLERMRREISGGKSYRQNTTPDPYDMQKQREDALKGEDRDAHYKWKRVMEYHGFVWLSAEQVTRIIGPLKLTVRGSSGNAYVLRAQKYGQWRRFGRPGSRVPDQKWAMGLRTSDLIMAHQTPERFDDWIRLHDNRIRAKEGGMVVLPDSLRRQRYNGAPKAAVPDALIVDPNAPEQPRKTANQATRTEPIRTPEGS